MEDNILSAHKLLIHSNDYKKTNALNVLYIFILFAASIGIRFFMENLKNNGMDFTDNSLPGIIYYLSPGLAVITGLLLIIAPFSILRSFYFDIIEIYQNGIRITSMKNNKQMFITYDKFNLTPAADKKTGSPGFVIDIKRVTLKRSLYYYNDFENPQSLEENLKEYAYWKAGR